MNDQATCGQGLAGNATLPATAGELMDAMAHLLDVHQQALDLTDENARPEHAAYATLVRELRAISAQLAATAKRMAGYHGLPMGRHDERRMESQEAFDAFDHFVRSERALQSLLAASLSEHETMLEEMRKHTKQRS